jgi:hypothetical protein
MTPQRLIALHAFCWIVPFLFTFPVFMESLYAPEDDPATIGVPGTYYCSPRNYSHFTLYLFFIPWSVFILICIVNFFIAFPMMMWRNYHIFYFQWRTLVFGFETAVTFIFSLFLAYYFTDQWDFQTILAYALCVAANPSDPNPPCSPQYWSDFWYFSLFSVLIYGWVCVFPVYVYWTSPLTWVWWYVLLVEWKIPSKEAVLSSQLITKSGRTNAN